MRTNNSIIVLLIDRRQAMTGQLTLPSEFELVTAVDFQAASGLLGWNHVGAIVLSINPTDDPAWIRGQFRCLGETYPQASKIIYAAENAIPEDEFDEAFLVCQPDLDVLTKLIITTAHETAC